MQYYNKPGQFKFPKFAKDLVSSLSFFLSAKNYPKKNALTSETTFSPTGITKKSFSLSFFGQVLCKLLLSSKPKSAKKAKGRRERNTESKKTDLRFFPLSIRKLICSTVTKRSTSKLKKLISFIENLKN